MNNKNESLDSKFIPERLVDNGSEKEENKGDRCIEDEKSFMLRLNHTPPELHKKFAIELIENKKGLFFVAANLDRFSGLDRDVALRLIDHDLGEVVKNSLDEFSGFKSNPDLNFINELKDKGHEEVASYIEELMVYD